MKRILFAMLFAMLFIITPSYNSVDARFEIDDGGGGGTPAPDLCGRSATLYQYSSYRTGVLDCTLESAYDIDYVKHTSYKEGMVSIYSTGSTNLTIKVYRGSFSSTPIIVSSNNIGKGQHYTDYQNFYIDVYMDAGVSYYFEISSTDGVDYGTYDLVFDECNCVNNNLFAYKLSDFTFNHSVAVNNGSTMYVYLDTIFEDEMTDAIAKWNNLGVIDIIIVNYYTYLQFYNSGLKIVKVTDYYPDGTEGGRYNPLPIYVKQIELNANKYEYITKVGYDFSKFGTSMHELGHALGINLDRTDSLKEFIYGEDNWHALVDAEERTNVMRYNRLTIYDLGPCDIAMYYYLWGPQ